MLSRHPFAANWTLEATAKRVDSTDYDRNRTAWLTPGYAPSQFESRPVAYLSGGVTWPPPSPLGSGCGSVALMDPSTKFAAEQFPNYGSSGPPNPATSSGARTAKWPSTAGECRFVRPPCTKSTAQATSSPRQT